MFDFMRSEEVRRWRDEFALRFPLAWPAMHGGHERTAMVLDGYGASVMLAPRLEGDQNHGLPPGVSAPAYLVAQYEGCPSGWRRQRDAFFVPIPMDSCGKGPGMWYDWTTNGGHTHDIAVVPSTTGLNPITFRKADALRLERYSERCPVHDVAFEGDRFCQQCTDGQGLKWPPQNYVAAPNTLWWDGFRRPDGTVRQFWFSDDVLRRDVGVAVLGADRVPAFGFAIFRSKEAKPPAYSSLMVGAAGSPFAYGQLEKGGGMCSGFGGGVLRSFNLGDRLMGSGDDSPTPAIRRVRSAGSIGAIRREAVERTVAVGAGSGITQDLRPDPRSLDEWQTEPAAVITVYFVPEETAVKILQSPQRDLTGPREGVLGSIPGLQLGTE